MFEKFFYQSFPVMNYTELNRRKAKAIHFFLKKLLNILLWWWVFLRWFSKSCLQFKQKKDSSQFYTSEQKNVAMGILLNRAVKYLFIHYFSCILIIIYWFMCLDWITEFMITIILDHTPLKFLYNICSSYFLYWLICVKVLSLRWLFKPVNIIGLVNDQNLT